MTVRSDLCPSVRSVTWTNNRTETGSGSLLFVLGFLSRQFSGHAHRQLTFQDPELACLLVNIS